VSEDEVLALVETFFAEGGQELQVSSLDPDRLRQAQMNPGAHGDLVVRIAGFSGRFVDLSKLEQDELITRAEAATGCPSR
jgi:formate C-acetyltransferase